MKARRVQLLHSTSYRGEAERRSISLQIAAPHRVIDGLYLYPESLQCEVDLDDLERQVRRAREFVHAGPGGEDDWCCSECGS